jgi:serine/threonine protein phosphatase PrpC
VVANCGDSRLLTDDGSGSSHFRTVTRDHRVEDVTERARLDRYMETHGQAAHLVQHRDTLRLYPGGLAVSRTIGDVGFTAAAVPTPDVYRIPLWGAGETEGEAREVSETTSQSQEGRKVRFVLATDGIWDILSNTEVGELVAQDGRDGVARSPHEAARAVMNECLRRTGGHHGEFPFSR